MSNAAFLLDAGHAGLPGLFFGQAFTVMSLSWDLLALNDTKGPEFEAYAVSASLCRFGLTLLAVSSELLLS